MKYQIKWIEGEDNLEDFCMKCFKERPSFIEKIGRCASAKIFLVYKYRKDRDYYATMFLLIMQHQNGAYTYSDIMDKIYKYSYEQIRTDRTAILDE